MEKKEIYMDHSATTCMDPEVKREMDKYFCEEFGNPGSFHTIGLRVKRAVDNARERVAGIINAKPSEVIFTGSGTESCNLAIKGIAFAQMKNSSHSARGHIITSKIEHHAVLDTCKWLEKQGFSVTYLPVDKYGLVSPEQVEKAIKKDTILITIMYANNEIGTIEPIREIAKIAKKHNTPFHTDACQTGLLDIDVERLGVDMMTLNGSKIYGPKGIGMLFVRTGIRLVPLIHGGGQEGGKRSGTENVPYIIGFAKALELAQKNRANESKRLSGLRDKLIKGILENIPKSFLNGHPIQRLPNNVNVSILDVEGESVLLRLDESGIYAATGSACTSKSLDPSYVILATGLSKGAAHGSLRFSLGKLTTEADIDKIVNILPKIINELRDISPVNLSEKEIRTDKK